MFLSYFIFRSSDARAAQKTMATDLFQQICSYAFAVVSAKVHEFMG